MILSTPLPLGRDLSDTAATLATWSSRGGLWGAKLTRNYAGAWYLHETKRGRSIGGRGRPRGFYASDAQALADFRMIVPQIFDVAMTEEG